MRKTMMAWFPFVCMFFLATHATAAKPHIFRVVADKTKQSGFRLKGTKGIVTALHGVIGAQSIKAMSASGPAVFIDLKIRMVDIERDVALLCSKELEALPAHGLEQAQRINWDSLKKVIAVGYPDEVVFEEIETSLIVREIPVKPLYKLVGEETRRRLVERNSPNPNLGVISIEGALVPGHSGAPILTPTNRVLAICNGGLSMGTSEIGWGIPLASVRWTGIDGRTRIQMDAIARTPSQLFGRPKVTHEPTQISPRAQAQASIFKREYGTPETLLARIHAVKQEIANIQGEASSLRRERDSFYSTRSFANPRQLTRWRGEFSRLKNELREAENREYTLQRDYRTWLEILP